MRTWTMAEIDARTEAEADGCWLWRGALTAAGYGMVRSEGKNQYVHRLVYEAAHGPLSAGDVVRHACDRPACINPDHLVLGTQKDNVGDMRERNRMCVGSRHPLAKLTEEQVAEIWALHCAGEGVPSIVRSTGVAKWTVSDIVRGKRWRHVTQEG